MNPQSSSKEAITLPRYDFLDGIRAFLAIVVVIHHAWYTVNDYNGKGLSPYFHVMIRGHYAVCFFIILSGFCLMLPVLNNNFELLHGVRFFLRRRAWRILPPYYFALLLSLLAIVTLIHNKTGAHWDISLPVTPYNIATHVFLIHNFFPDHFYKIDHVLWSVAVEFQIYFLFPILLACWRTIGAFFTTVIAVVVSSLMEMGATAFFHIGPALHFIGLFALGMSAACIGFSSSRPVFLWGMISIGTFAVFLVMTSIHSASRPFHDVLFGFFAASILIYITITPKGLLHAIFNFKPLVFIGSFSYSLYLIHAPLLQILWQYPFSSLQTRPNAMFLALTLVGAPIIVFVSYLFFLGCEKPFLQKKRGHKIVHVK